MNGAVSVQVVPAEARDFQGHSAGVVTRVAANAIDVLIAAGIVVALYLGWAAVLFLRQGRDFTFPTVGWPTAITVLGIVLTVYFAVSWTTGGRTYGDQVLGLRVLATDDARLGAARSVLRAIVCVLFPLLLFWAALSRDQRSVQDLLVRTKVVYDWRAGRAG